ncbi:23819_t:CDS:2, partial [Gigaspora rosea]
MEDKTVVDLEQDLEINEYYNQQKSKEKKSRQIKKRNVEEEKTSLKFENHSTPTHLKRKRSHLYLKQEEEDGDSQEDDYNQDKKIKQEAIMQKKKPQSWTKEEDAMLLELIHKHGFKA